MSKILKNNTVVDIAIGDVGITIPGSGQITIDSVNDLAWADSSDILTYIGSGDVIVNDGTSDLTKNLGAKLVQGIFRQDFVAEVRPVDSLKDNYEEMISLLFKINENLEKMNFHFSIVTDEEL